MKSEIGINVATSGEGYLVPTTFTCYSTPAPIILILLLIATTSIGCHSKYSLPKPSSTLYSDYASSFYVGLAALQVGDDVRADTELEKSTRLVPGEPAGW